MKKTILTMMLAGTFLLSSCEGNYPTLNTTPIAVLPTETTTQRSPTWGGTSSLSIGVSTIGVSQSTQGTTEVPIQTTPLQTTSERTTASQITETTTVTQTTETIKPTETTVPMHPPVATEGSDEIVLNGLGWSIETPSRIIFDQSEEGFWSGNDYVNGMTYGICYYSKADGESYVYCYDPLCNHTNCAQRYFVLGESFLIGNRFYTFDENYDGKTVVRSFGVDGTDIRIDWDSENESDMKLGSFNGYGYPEFAYGKYLFIWTSFSDGTRHTLRFDTESEKMEDLTAKTGNTFTPSFAYEDMLYGYSVEYGGYVKTDLSLSSFTEAEEYVQAAFARENANGESTRFIHEMAIGHRIYGTVITEKENGESESLIQVLDMKAGTVTQISDETFGRDAACVIYADAEYLYYLANEPVYVGVNTKYNTEVYNTYGGRIYRARLDGSGSECIFEDPEMNFYAGYRAYICGEDFLIYAAKITMRGGISKVYASGTYIGHFDSTGRLETLAYADVIS